MTIIERLENALEKRAKMGSLRTLIYSSSRREEQHTGNNSDSKKAQKVKMIDFSSNDYLGLAHCSYQLEKVSKEFEIFKQKVVDTNGDGTAVHPPLLGATGSRLLSGDSSLSHNVEDRLSKVHHREGTLLFNSGYDANLSILSCIPMPQDFIVMDELCHNSLIMGVRMGRGRGENTLIDDETRQTSTGQIIMFRHNETQHLSEILRDIGNKLNDNSQIFIVVESVYSMDGDIAPLKKIFDLADSYQASVIVDEAHGLGVYGVTNRQNLIVADTNDQTRSDGTENSNTVMLPNATNGGTGVLAALGLEDHPRCLCSIHTFGKAAGCHGAVVAASKIVIQYLINYARPFIYSTALPPHSIISIKCAYESMMSIEGEKRRFYVFYLVHLFRKEALKQGIQLSKSPSPIQAVLINNLTGERYANLQNNELCIRLASTLRRNGLDVYPIRFPTVKKGEERIRIILHFHNTVKEVMELLAVLKDFYQNGRGNMRNTRELQSRL